MSPDAACNTGSTFTLPGNSTTYPVLITTAASSPMAAKICDDGRAAALAR